MNTKNKIILILIIIDAVIINASVGYLIYKSQITNYKYQIGPSNNTSVNDITPVVNNVDQCGTACQAYIDQKIASISALKPTQANAGTSGTPKVVYVPQTVKAPKVRTTSYVTVPGSGSTTNNDWADLPGTEFYFNPTDYPGLVEVYFEVNMKLFNGNGMAYVQLFDVTHGVGVQGSDVQTNSQLDGLTVSGKVSFWAGKNLIQVQAKSLTADTAIFTSGRLRIVTEN